MILSFVLSRLDRLARRRRFAWTPQVDLRDPAIYSTLLPVSLS